MKIVAVIPARYESSRFPGKPLCDICGKPMIWWVYHNCIKVKEFSRVIVATDDSRIFDVCTQLNMDVIMTSKNHITGTDRVGEISKIVNADLIVNVQGDEPLLEPETIAKVIPPFIENPNLEVCNLMTEIDDPVDVVNFTIPKVITNESGIGIYLTRAPAPYPKGSIDFKYYKQVCVYGFKPSALNFFCEYGIKKGKSKIEKIEDIELLRFIENGYKVQFIEVKTRTVAVDTKKDLQKVIELMKAKLDNDA